MGKPMRPNDGDGPCVFRHTRYSGGRVGTICGRPENDHCPEKPGAHEDYMALCRKVHHPYHRARAKEKEARRG